MTDHATFEDRTQEERAEHQMIEHARRMRRKASIGQDALERIRDLTGPWQSIAEAAHDIARTALDDMRGEQ